MSTHTSPLTDRICRQRAVPAFGAAVTAAALLCMTSIASAQSGQSGEDHGAAFVARCDAGASPAPASLDEARAFALEASVTVEQVEVTDFYGKRLVDEMHIAWTADLEAAGADCLWVGRQYPDNPELRFEAILEPGENEFVTLPTFAAAGGEACYTLVPVLGENAVEATLACALVETPFVPIVDAPPREEDLCEEFLPVDNVVMDPALDVELEATLEVVPRQDERFTDRTVYDEFVIRWNNAATEAGAECIWVGEGLSDGQAATPNLALAVLDGGAREWSVIPQVDSEGGLACYRLVPMSAVGVGPAVELCGDVVNARVPEFPHSGPDAPGPPEVGSGVFGRADRGDGAVWAAVYGAASLAAAAFLVLRRR